VGSDSDGPPSGTAAAHARRAGHRGLARSRLARTWRRQTAGSVPVPSAPRHMAMVRPAASPSPALPCNAPSAVVAAVPGRRNGRGASVWVAHRLVAVPKCILDQARTSAQVPVHLTACSPGHLHGAPLGTQLLHQVPEPLPVAVHAQVPTQCCPLHGRSHCHIGGQELPRLAELGSGCHRSRCRPAGGRVDRHSRPRHRAAKTRARRQTRVVFTFRVEGALLLPRRRCEAPGWVPARRLRSAHSTTGCHRGAAAPGATLSLQAKAALVPLAPAPDLQRGRGDADSDACGGVPPSRRPGGAPTHAQDLLPRPRGSLCRAGCRGWRTWSRRRARGACWLLGHKRDLANLRRQPRMPGHPGSTSFLAASAPWAPAPGSRVEWRRRARVDTARSLNNYSWAVRPARFPPRRWLGPAHMWQRLGASHTPHCCHVWVWMWGAGGWCHMPPAEHSGAAACCPFGCGGSPAVVGAHNGRQASYAALCIGLSPRCCQSTPLTRASWAVRLGVRACSRRRHALTRPGRRLISHVEAASARRHTSPPKTDQLPSLVSSRRHKSAQRPCCRSWKRRVRPESSDQAWPPPEVAVSRWSCDSVVDARCARPPPGWSPGRLRSCATSRPSSCLGSAPRDGARGALPAPPGSLPSWAVAGPTARTARHRRA